MPVFEVAPKATKLKDLDFLRYPNYLPVSFPDLIMVLFTSHVNAAAPEMTPDSYCLGLTQNPTPTLTLTSSWKILVLRWEYLRRSEKIQKGA